MITPAKEINKEFLEGEYDNLFKKKINEDTCKFFNYQVGKDKGKPVHIANYYDSNHKVIAQHLRYPNKSFKWIGDFQKQHCLVNRIGEMVARKLYLQKVNLIV